MEMIMIAALTTLGSMIAMRRWDRFRTMQVVRVRRNAPR